MNLLQQSNSTAILYCQTNPTSLAESCHNKGDVTQHKKSIIIILEVPKSLSNESPKQPLHEQILTISFLLCSTGLSLRYFYGI